MRILHVLAERGFSGGENQLRATVRHLRDHGHEQLLVVDDRARFVAVARELGVETHLLRIRNNADLLAALRLHRAMRALAPDLVHFACSRSHKIGTLAALGARGLPPRVVTRRMDYRIPRTPFHRFAYRGAVDAVVVISTGVRDAVLATGIDPARVHLIHEGVDTARFAAVRDPARRDAARAALGLGVHDLCGVTTASLHHRKGHDVLLAALAGLRLPGGARLVWVLAGRGPEHARLAAAARALPPSVDVRLPGQVDDVPGLLGAADLFCLPSRHEGLGVALLEAVAAGLPCVASRVGGMRDVFVDGESGLHVAAGDVVGLRAALQALIDDPARARGLAAAGQARARAVFDVARMGRETEALYARLAAPR